MQKLETFKNEEKILFYESLQEITNNTYEKDKELRNKCLNHHGYTCSVCEKNLLDIYGIKDKYVMQVHLIKQLDEIKKNESIDQIKDLTPVCFTCHTIIHSKQPFYTIEEMKHLIKKENK